MPWTYVGVSNVASSSSGNITLTEPSGCQEGDLLVAIISYRSNAAFTNPGSPWANVTSQNTGNTTANQTTSIGSGAMFYCVRGASAPGLTFTRTAGDIALGRIVAYRGGNRSSNVLVTQTSTTLAAAATAVSVTGLTTQNARDLIVVGFCGARNTNATQFDAATDPTTTSGTAADETGNPAEGDWQERCDSGTNTGADTTLAIADALRATAGATGNLTMTAGASARHVVVAAAFKEVPDRTLTATQQTYSVSGVTTSIRATRSLSGTQQTYSVSGVSSDLQIGVQYDLVTGTTYDSQTTATYQDFRLPLGGGGAPYTITADQASIAVSVFNAGLSVARKLSATQQTYSASGVSVGLAATRRLTATQQTYSVSTVSTALRAARRLTATQQTYSASGVSVNLRAARTLSSLVQTYSASGVSVNLRAARSLSATQQTYSVSGVTAGLQAVRRLSGVAQSYLVTGQTIGLSYVGSDPVLNAFVQTYSVTGNSAGLSVSRLLSPAVQSLSVTPVSTPLKSARQLSADLQTYDVTGVTTTLTKKLGRRVYIIT